MKPSEAISANQAAWDEAAPRFRERMHAYLLKRFEEPGYSYIRGAQLQVLRKLGVTGKAVAQLCCNNGREVLSLKNMGAGYCVGFDLSAELIAQGRELAAAGKIDCELIHCDIHDISGSFNGRFDLVLVTVGTLRWMPDVNAFVAVAKRLLKQGGRLFINEMHPILDVFQEGEADRVRWERSYFHKGPIVSRTGIAYQGVEEYEAKPHVWYHHRLSDVVSAILRQDMELRALDELAENISGSYKYLHPAGVKPPMSYILVAKKKAPVRTSVSQEDPINSVID